MSDPLGEALCPHGDPFCPCPDGDPCHYEGPDRMPCYSAVAARSWHTLTNPSEALINAADPFEIFVAGDGERGIRPRSGADILRAVVDALTVTAEP